MISHHIGSFFPDFSGSLLVVIISLTTVMLDICMRKATSHTCSFVISNKVASNFYIVMNFTQWKQARISSVAYLNSASIKTQQLCHL